MFCSYSYSSEWPKGKGRGGAILHCSVKGGGGEGEEKDKCTKDRTVNGKKSVVAICVNFIEDCICGLLPLLSTNYSVAISSRCRSLSISLSLLERDVSICYVCRPPDNDKWQMMNTTLHRIASHLSIYKDSPNAWDRSSLSLCLSRKCVCALLACLLLSLFSVDSRKLRQSSGRGVVKVGWGFPSRVS